MHDAEGICDEFTCMASWKFVIPSSTMGSQLMLLDCAYSCSLLKVWLKSLPNRWTHQPGSWSKPSTTGAHHCGWRKCVEKALRSFFFLGEKKHYEDANKLKKQMTSSCHWTVCDIETPRRKPCILRRRWYRTYEGTHKWQRIRPRFKEKGIHHT